MQSAVHKHKFLILITNSETIYFLAESQRCRYITRLKKKRKHAHRIHEGELLCHHYGVKRQEAESRKLVLKAALFLCGKRAADVFPCREASSF